MEPFQRIRIFTFLTLAATLVFTTACSTTATATLAPEKPACDLSSLKVKDVKIENDQFNLVTDALKSEMYSRGATYDKNGKSLAGVALFVSTGGAPVQVSVDVTEMGFAGVAGQSIDILRVMNPAHYANQLATDIVDHFCEAAASRATPKK